MAAEILGMLVDQTNQFFHQPAERPMLREPGDDCKEPAIASGQDLERPDIACANSVTRHCLPKAAALFGCQRPQRYEPEQFEEGFLRILQLFEPAGCGCKQDHSRLGLESATELPSEVFIYIAAERLQVLDYQHQLHADALGHVQNGRACEVPNGSLAPAFRQFVVRFLQLPRRVGISCLRLPCQMKQGLQPKVGYIEYFVVLLHEPYRQEDTREFFVGPQFRRHPGEQHGLAPTTGRDNENMLA